MTDICSTVTQQAPGRLSNDVALRRISARTSSAGAENVDGSVRSAFIMGCHTGYCPALPHQHDVSTSKAYKDTSGCEQACPATGRQTSTLQLPRSRGIDIVWAAIPDITLPCPINMMGLPARTRQDLRKPVLQQAVKQAVSNCPDQDQLLLPGHHMSLEPVHVPFLLKGTMLAKFRGISFNWLSLIGSLRQKTCHDCLKVLPKRSFSNWLLANTIMSGACNIFTNLR